MKVGRICEDCGAKFATYPSRAGRFCSRTCSGKAGNKARAERMRATFLTRFWSRVLKTSSCWLWEGAATSRGYGSLKKGGATVQAHVLSWTLVNGPPADLCVLHKCDTPLCVNPEHLFLGTKKDNNLDKVSKGRQPNHLGQGNPNSKLTSAEVAKIRLEYAEGSVRQVDLATKYGVKQAQISRITRKESW